MVNSKFFDLFQKDSVDKQLRIEFDGGVITNEELHNQQFELTESLCSESELRFGSCEASSIKFKISNIFTPLKDKWLTVSMTLNGNTTEPFLIGKYKVFSDVPTADRRFRDVVAYDAMYDIINTDVADWYNKVLPNKDSTMTLKEFRTKFLQHFGLEQKEIDLVNDNMLVEKTVEPSEISGKDVITAICEINGCFGHIGRDGKFCYVFLQKYIQGLYPANDLYPDHAPDYLSYQQETGDLYPQGPKSNKIGNNIYIDCQYEDFVTKNISKLQIRKEKNDIGAIAGTGDNCYIIEDNFLVYGKSAEDLDVIVNNIFSVISDVSFRPFSADCKGNPCFEVGDAVRFITKYEIVESYILKRTLKGVQALRDTYESEGEEIYSEKVNSVNKSIIELKGKTNVLERNVEETISTIADVEAGLSSRISQTVKSISMSIANDATEKSAEVKLSFTDEGGTEYEVTAEKIDFSGMVLFKNLETDGETVINGNNITTGSLISLVIDNGNGTFHVDPDGNLIAKNATLYGNLYGLDDLHLYNKTYDQNRKFISFYYTPEDPQFRYYGPDGKEFMRVTTQEEGVYFPRIANLKKALIQSLDVTVISVESIFGGTASGQGISGTIRVSGVFALFYGEIKLINLESGGTIEAALYAKYYDDPSEATLVTSDTFITPKHKGVRAVCQYGKHSIVIIFNTEGKLTIRNASSSDITSDDLKEIGFRMDYFLI